LLVDSDSVSAPRRALSEQGVPGNDNARVRADHGQVERPSMGRPDKRAFWPVRADATMGDDPEGEEHAD